MTLIWLLLQIERRWKELHERMEKFFKTQLSWLKDQGHNDPNNDTDRWIECTFKISGKEIVTS